MRPLAGKVGLVLGGTGEVGEGITRALLASGAIVAVASRDNEKLSALHDRLPAEWDGQYVPIVGDVGSAEGVAAVKDRVEFVCRRLDGSNRPRGHNRSGLGADAFRRAEATSVG